ncbi:1,4-dihydroxy-2-naphthoate polyprenyltransferase [Microbacterium saccharophilum]|uniref:1,4-dihydroxy-2-naphthoate octaprenyltransferase n=1 Tax=Microbacterium saccharophilum TaxID=1213358 RepID=A0A5C8HY30_9MICO|nr:1,4-dihydroxy-2-naphthoate polyprenyltransferase [Microbacterium saccharophilum]TXK11321.1 1,4-dihydroxy-2-naphthoate polyprenyltransferase [Microbacterium saccharophilum]GEP48772.1 1,4-dihydroxy-2-naphthoate octaprenyltransferase [Microbacterium saccharophilum]
MAASTRKKRPHGGSQKKQPRGNPQKAHVSRDPRAVTPATRGDWIGAARLRTLPLAVTPVLIGTGAALIVEPRLHWVIALCCLIVAVALQVGVNYANDYSDGIRGTDDHRVGPARLTASRKAKPRTVLIVALAFFALAAIAGLAIVIRTQHWWMLLIGAACIVAAWFYTGGKRPYGYAGLGELFVFVFFGLVATIGTTFVQVGIVPQEAWFGAVAAGMLACAVLLANNLRDIDQDRVAGKRTLTVRIGKRATQVLYTVLVLLPFGIAAVLALVYPIAWLTLLALIPAAAAILIVWTYRLPRELVVALALTSLTSVAVGGFLFWAFAG